MLAGRPRRGSPPEDDWDGGRQGGRRRAAGSGRAADTDRGDRTGRFSQTADDLRNRLGIRGSVVSRDRDAGRPRRGEEDGLGRGADAGNGRRAGRPDDDFWDEPAPRGSAGRAAGRRAGGAVAGGAVAGGAVAGGAVAGRMGRWRAAGEAAIAARGSRRAAAHFDQTGDRLDGRTALRDQPDDFWADGEATGRGLRSRIAERPGLRRSGPGGGPGGGGPGGGGPGGGGRGSGRGGRRADNDPRSGGERFKDWLLYGSWWRHWTWKKALTVAGGAIVALVLVVVAGFFYLYEKTPIPTAADVIAQANYQSSTVYYADGRPMGTFSYTDNGTVIDRVLLKPNQIPGVMTQAMTAAEDRHFYSEGGVSVTGLLRAAYDDVFGSGNLQGASTITMQYAKNYYAGVDTGRNFSTKLKEIFIAMKLGHARSKQFVMTNYLNTVPFGPTVDGLGAAARSYFNIDLTKPDETLTTSQAAMLAAMPNAPGTFSPDPAAGPAYTDLVARWKYVVANMVRDGNITAQAASALKFPAYNPPPAGNGETGTTAYLMNMVEQQLEAPPADGGYGLTQQQVDTRGYRITTTFSAARMRELARSISQEKATMQADALQTGYQPFQKYDRIGSVLENAKTGAIVAVYGGPGWPTSFGPRAKKRCGQSNCFINMAEEAEPVGSSFKPIVLSTAVSEGMNVFTSRLNGYSPIWIPLSTPGPTPAQYTLSPTHQPPGCPAASVNTACQSTNGTSYFVFNETGENYGVLPVNVAAAESSDAAFEDLAHRAGIQSVIDMAKALGVGQNAFVEPCGDSSGTDDSVAQTIAACNDMTGPGYEVKTKAGKVWVKGNGLNTNFSPSTKDRGGLASGNPGSPAIALGENPLTPVEQATVFATLADDGVYHTPHVIASLQWNGSTIASNVHTQRVLTPAAAADVDWALSFDNNYPTGTADGSVPFDRGYVIGKTGTLGSGANASQAWFIGSMAENYALSVALFTNDPAIQNLDNLPGTGGNSGSYGGAWPATIWNNFMSSEFGGAPPVPLFTTLQQNGPPFVKWILANPKKKTKPTCKPGQFQNCTCPKGAAPNCGHPNPGRSCQPGFGQPCNGNSPSPSTSCQPFGQCNSPPPTPPTTPTPSPSATCTSPPGPPCTGTTNAKTTSSSRGSPGSSSSAAKASAIATLAAEGAVVAAMRLGLIT
jgi:membrane peptidoglycan carboxypeptidase